MALQTFVFLPLLSLLYIILFTMLLFKQKNKHHKKHNLPPSPPKLPIVGNLHQLGELPHRSLWNLSKEFGSIMLMQLGCKPTLVVSSAQWAEEIMKTHDVEFCSRPSFVSTKRLSYNFLDITSVPYGEYWREMRKITVLHLLNAKMVDSYRFSREEEVAHMIKFISKSSSKPINLTNVLFSLQGQIVSRIAFSKSYKGRDFDSGIFEEFLYEALFLLGRFPATDLFPYIGWIVDRFTGVHGRLEKCFHDFDTFSQQLIDDHTNSGRVKPEQEDIIDVLLRLQKDQLRLGATRLTNDHIKAMLMNILIGGIDSGAVTMVWAMTELAKNPTAMKKVQEEIRNCIGEKGKVEESDVQQLQYLKLVVKETLRLHPPGALLVPRETRHQCKINGYDIYPKTIVLVNVWAIGRSPDYWENPDEFLPERFMDGTIDFRGNDFNFLPFGAGRRGCPGINMAISTVELALANLLYCFDWKLPSGMKNEDIDMDEKSGLAVHKKSALYLVPINHK